VREERVLHGAHAPAEDEYAFQTATFKIPNRLMQGESDPDGLMPRYFFNIDGVEHLSRDVTGEELPDDDAARAEAAIQIGEISSEASNADWDMTEWRMIVTASDGRKIADLAIKAGTRSAKRAAH
jgi:hypothetical protein